MSEEDENDDDDDDDHDNDNVDKKYGDDIEGGRQSCPNVGEDPGGGEGAQLEGAARRCPPPVAHDDGG